MPAPNIDGFWRNELDSQMELKVTGIDVCGTYKTAVGDPNAQRELPLKGILHYPLISFFVDFPATNSICTWMGRFEFEEVNPDGGESELVLHTIWVLGSLFQDPAASQPTKVWNTFQINQDRFKRPPATTTSQP
jgi:hypothetical protein